MSAFVAIVSSFETRLLIVAVVITAGAVAPSANAQGKNANRSVIASIVLIVVLSLNAKIHELCRVTTRLRYAGQNDVSRECGTEKRSPALAAALCENFLMT
jgi:hypothetical protein